MILNKSEEQWREIKGFEGQYAVSDKGNIKNLKNGKILAGAYHNTGYKIVNLKGKRYMVHRLTALAFIPNPDNLPYINHKNEKKDDNNVGNLEWCSAAYNVNYSSHKRYCRVKQLTKDGKLIKVWESLTQIEKELGCNTTHIISACKGRQPYSHGFKWQYANPESQREYNHPIAVYKGTKHIGEFASVAKASKALGLCDRSVYYCLSGRFASTKGYTFKYAE